MTSSLPILLTVLLIDSILCSIDPPCSSIPSQSDFFSSQQLDLICHHREHWMKERDENVSKDEFEKPTRKQKAYLTEIERCTRVNCLVEEKRRPKREVKKTIRREIRMMTRDERKAVFDAMNSLKSIQVDNITAWDLHTLVHYPDSAPGAHWGPAFLPWHREFLRQFEISLQKERRDAFLPYWDSTLDEGLPRPADSVLWTDELLGNGNGYVKTGPFADWQTNVKMPLSEVPVTRLYRSTGGREQDRLLSPRDVQWVESRQNYSQLTFCHDKTFESMHGLSHVWVGGFMFVIRVSPNDPSFYMHHAFVDYLWERFRQKQQTREQRENDYAIKTCSKLQDIDAQMKPFGIMNRDGLSNRYTDEWYEYEPITHCSTSRPFCSSPFLFCDEKAWKCRSKVVLGGNCTGFESSAICYKSTCIRGSCRLPPRVEQAKRAKSAVTSAPLDEIPLRKFSTSLKRGILWTKTLLIDEDGFGLRDSLATVTVDYGGGSATTVSLNETIKYPELPGVVYVPLPKIRSGEFKKVTVTARDSFGRYCQANCYNSTVERHHVCDGILSISHSISTSSPLSFTHDPSSRRFLDADLSVHPRLISVTPPFLVFACSRKLVTSQMIWSIANTAKPPRDREDHVFMRVTLSRPDIVDLQVESSSPMDTWRSPVSRSQSPVDPSILFVRVPNPETHPEGVTVRVSFLLRGTRLPCNIKCTNEDGWSEECDGTVHLHRDPAQSAESVFSSDQSVLPLLGWKMQSHPSTWSHRVPYLSFVC